MNEEMKYNRINWIDISKFIAITMVCLGHIGLPKVLSMLIHIFHMPVFFIVSGICYNEEKYTRFLPFLIKRVKTLLVPSYFWCFAMYFIWRIYCLFEMRGDAVTLLEFVFLAFTKDAKVSMFGNFGVIQWFFTSLFFAELLFWCIVTLVRKINIMYRKYLLFGTVVVLVVINYFYVTFVSVNPLGVGTSILGTVFIIIGFGFKAYFNKGIKWGRVKEILVFVLAVVALLISWIFNGSTNMRMLQYNNVLLFIAGALAGSYLIFQVAKFIEVKMNKMKLIYGWMLYIGRNTLIVLVFNRFIQFTLVRGINYLIKLIDFSWENIVGLIILVAIDLVVEMIAFTPVIYLVNRYIPFSSGKIK